MRRATQQALSIPAFRAPADCTPWVLGGLWPAELNQVTPETATLATYLRNDLQRIADSANDKLRELAEAGLPEPVRQAEENRVVNVARAFAVLRVESTLRHLRREPLGFGPAHLLLGAAPEEPTQAVTVAQPAAAPAPAVVDAATDVHEVTPVDEVTVVQPVTSPEPVSDSPAVADPEPTPEPTVLEAVSPESQAPPPPPEPARTNGHGPITVESAEQRLRRLLQFVARQEPGLAWVVADRADGTTVVATDLAYGWVPPGIDLPGGVVVLPPQRRTMPLAALVEPAERKLTYRPGDPFPRATDTDVTAPSREARAVPEVADLGWQLSEATQWREGLPRIVHTMARAGAGGTGVVDAEVDVLRVHVDTARYQMFAQYPDVHDRLLTNCLLLSATEALVTGDPIAANYHFAWYLALTSTDGTGWRAAGGASQQIG